MNSDVDCPVKEIYLCRLIVFFIEEMEVYISEIDYKQIDDFFIILLKMF